MMKKMLIFVVLMMVMGHLTSAATHTTEETVPAMTVGIRYDHNKIFEAGTPRVLACVVYGNVKPLKITWYIGNTEFRTNVYKEMSRGNFTVSTMTFVPSMQNNGKDLVCKVTTNRTTLQDKITVIVGQRPKCSNSAFITIGAVEGDSETLVCIVDSDPEPEQFVWTFADKRTIYTSSKTVLGFNNRYSTTLAWVPKKDDFGPLYCRASNRFGEQKQPCTFSVINGGPPTTPECQLFWKDQETLNVLCDKNWEGGRPQTIHLEIKDLEGTRRLSRKGHELTVNALHPSVTSTAVLYASNSRGRSSAVQLPIPKKPAERNGRDYWYETKPAQWAVIMNFLIIVGFLTVLIIICLYLDCCQICFFGMDDDVAPTRDEMEMDAINNNDTITVHTPSPQEGPQVPEVIPIVNALAEAYYYV